MRTFSHSSEAKPNEEETAIKENKVLIKEKKMKTSQTYRADSVPRRPKSGLRGLMQRLSLTFFAFTLVAGVVEGQQAAPPIDGVIGKLQLFDGKALDVMTPAGAVHVTVKEPLTTYKQIPSDLGHVATAPYIGVASTEQADGKQVAKQIFIFPPELRGAAEGSVLTDPPGATSHSRMTNGTVARPSHSRMTNGTVQKSGGTTLVVNYQDGSQTISVPPDVPVTEVAPQTVTFSPGDVVYATTEKLPDGTLVTDKIFQFVPAAASH
jgi:hypothetical protein